MKTAALFAGLVIAILTVLPASALGGYLGGGMNLYEYVKSAPTKYIDASGAVPCIPGPNGEPVWLPWPEPREHPASPAPQNTGSYQTGFELHRGDTAAVRRRAEQFDEDAAAYHTAKEMLEQLEKRSQGNCCIKEWRIHGHGWGTYHKTSGLPGSQGRYPASETPNPNPNPGARLSLGLYYELRGERNNRNRAGGGRDLADLRALVTAERIVFCKPCKIRLYFCRVGEDFAKKLSSITECRVYYSRGICSPVHTPDGTGEIPGQAVSGPNTPADRRTPGGPSWGAYEKGKKVDISSDSEITAPNQYGTNKIIPGRRTP